MSVSAARTSLDDSGWRGGVAALLIYSALSVLFFGRAIGGGMSSFYIGNGPDPPQSIWFLAWGAHAISARLNPLFTAFLWVPHGSNIAWTANIPLATCLMLPFTRTLGPVAAYNLLALLCPVLAGCTAFVLCRRITRAFAPALLGGFIFGFSPYMCCKLLGNINLALIAILPIAVYLAVRALEASISSRSFVLLFAAALCAQFLLFIEVFATMTMSIAIALAIALLVCETADRSRIRSLLPLVLLSYGAAAVLLSPYLYYLFAFGFPRGAIWSTNTGSLDLLNFIIPVPTNALGTISAMRSVSSHFRAGIYDAEGYLGLMLVVTIAAGYRRGREPAIRILLLFAGAVGVLAMGPWMQVAGRFFAPMPWILVSTLPLLTKAVPARLTVYMFLALGILCAIWTSPRPGDSTNSNYGKWIVAALVVVSILPNLDSSFWATTLNTPEFFSARLYRQYIRPGETIMVLPYGFEGDGMLWQALSDFEFRQAGGYTGFAPPIPDSYENWPIVDALYDVAPIPEASQQFRAFLKSHGVGAVVFADEGAHAIEVSHADGPGIWHRGTIPPGDRQVWNVLLGGLGVPGQKVGGVTLYQLPAQVREQWPSVDPVALQASAAAARFDALVSAAYAYIAGGRRFMELSPVSLQNADLLPRNWVGGPLLRSAQHPGKFLSGLMAAPAGSHRVEVGVRASYPALAPIIEKYRHYAAGIYFPYPRVLSSAHPPIQDPALMVMVFDFDQLARAARMSAAPPSTRHAAEQPARD
jgi:hypothetical protein